MQLFFASLFVCLLERRASETSVDRPNENSYCILGPSRLHPCCFVLQRLVCELCVARRARRRYVLVQNVDIDAARLPHASAEPHSCDNLGVRNLHELDEDEFDELMLALVDSWSEAQAQAGREFTLQDLTGLGFVKGAGNNFYAPNDNKYPHLHLAFTSRTVQQNQQLVTLYTIDFLALTWGGLAGKQNTEIWNNNKDPKLVKAVDKYSFPYSEGGMVPPPLRNAYTDQGNLAQTLPERMTALRAIAANTVAIAQQA